MSTLLAEEWTTQDGAVAVTVPDLTRFNETDPVAPLSAIWVSQDGTLTLGVVELTLPRPMELLRASLEEGFTEEMNGEIVASSIESQDGRKLFVMTARGRLFEKEVFATQTILTLGDRMYKAMATGIGKDTRINPDAVNFIQSFRILRTDRVAKDTGDMRALKPKSHGDDQSLIDMLSRRIGGASVLLLLGCLAAMWRRRAKNRSKTLAK